jgi:hypothetical protein
MFTIFPSMLLTRVARADGAVGTKTGGGFSSFNAAGPHTVRFLGLGFQRLFDNRVERDYGGAFFCRVEYMKVCRIDSRSLYYSYSLMQREDSNNNDANTTASDYSLQHLF